MLVSNLPRPIVAALLPLVKMSALAAVSLVATTAYANTNTLTSINLKQALQRTLQYAPALQRYPFQEREAEALRLQAGLRPTTKLTLSIENAMGTGPQSDFDSAEYTLGLSQLIELGDKRQARIGLTEARWQSELAAYESSRLQLLAETGRRYYDLLLQQALSANIEKRAQGEKHALNIIEQRQRAGAVAAADAAKMRLRLAQTTMRQRQSLAQINRNQAQLASLWLQSPNFSRVEGNLLQLPPMVDLTALMIAMDKSPAYQQKMTQEKLAQADVRQQQALSRSDVTIGLGIRHLEDSSDQALVFDVSMPLAIGNPNRGNLQAAYSRQNWSETDLELTRQEISLQLHNLGQHLKTLRQQTQFLETDLLPKAEILLREVEQGYRQGRYSVLQWVDAQSELFQLHTQQIVLHHSIFIQRLELERISGQPLIDDAENTQLNKASNEPSKQEEI